MAKKPPKKPRKPKGKASAKAAPATEPVQAKDVTGMITAGVLNSILALDKRTKKQQSELAGELGQKVAAAVERFGTNRKALGTIRALNRMEPEKVADFLDHLEYMLDISGIQGRADAVQRLPLEPADEVDGEDVIEAEKEEQAVEEAGGADKLAGNVSRPRFGAPADGGGANGSGDRAAAKAASE